MCSSGTRSGCGGRGRRTSRWSTPCSGTCAPCGSGTRTPTSRPCSTSSPERRRGSATRSPTPGPRSGRGRSDGCPARSGRRPGSSGRPPTRAGTTCATSPTWRAGWSAEVPGLAFEDDFDGPDLDRSHGLPSYLPQWSSREQAAARYTVADGQLRLRIDADQPPWCPEFDGDVRVSSLQTGVFAGPLGSGIGQHRFTPEVVVREEQEPRRLWTPRYGRIEVRMAAPAAPDVMVALWMIGYEDAPERSAEICVCEIFGSEVTPERALVGMGVHPHGDPAVTDDFAKVEAGVDVREMHTYAVEWLPDRIGFLMDGELRKLVRQSPDYPMQLMLGLYEFGGPHAGDPVPEGAGRRARPRVPNGLDARVRRGRGGGDGNGYPAPTAQPPQHRSAEHGEDDG